MPGTVTRLAQGQGLKTGADGAPSTQQHSFSQASDTVNLILLRE